MKETLEGLEQFATEVILGERRGFRATALRTGLHGLSFIARGIIRLRLKLYRDRVKHDHNLGCLVISIGNLTMGGTGKTPVVELFARTLAERGRRVVVLSRGYKSSGVSAKRPGKFACWKHRVITGREMEMPLPRIVSNGASVLLGSEEAGDEPFMLAQNLLKSNVPVVVNRDRVAGGSYGIDNFGADTLILDDGLQYLRLKRRLDIVLVDRQQPWGNNYILPRGTLREPPRNLRRASYIFLTKCAPGEDNSEFIEREIRPHNRTAEVIECTHRPLYLRNGVTGEKKPLHFLRDKYVGALSGIAVPQSFENGLDKLGAKIELRRRFTDHYRFTDKEIREFVARCINRDVHAIITTEKDWVRFPDVTYSEIPVYYLRIQVEILNGHDAWENCISRICDRGVRAPALAL